MPNQEVLLYTVEQTAALLGYSRFTVSQMIRKGELQFIPRGTKHKRIPRSEIDKWISKNTIYAKDLKSKVDRRRSK